MKTLLLFSILIFATPKLFSQEENAGGEASPPTAQDGAEVPVTNTDPSKATKPKSRMRAKKSLPPNESSSFVGDPDNIDPLNANRDNIKDDNEPVLEDIKDVLNTKKTKKPDKTEKTETPPAVTEGADKNATTPQTPAPEVTPAPVVETPPPPAIVEPPPAPVVDTKTSPPPEPIAAPSTKGSGLVADEPDLELEKKFNDIYKRYNINPTSEDAWAAASGKQTARLYEIQKGDTLWSISKILFGDPNFWPKLWALNKQGILNPHFINPKMKIYFYEGDEEHSPTLTVGENQVAPEKEDAKPEAEEPVQEEAPVVGSPIPKKEAPVAEVDELPKGMLKKEKHEVSALASNEDVLDPKARVERKPEKKLGTIPPSLPESFNTAYFNPKKRVANIKIDFGTFPKSEFYYKSDLVLTDIPAQPEVTLGKSEDQKDRCRPGRVFKDIEFSGNLLDEYDIYEKLDGIDTSAGFKYAYRLVGTAKSRKEKYLMVTSCEALMSVDFVILPKNKMKELATQAQSESAEPSVIGGPDIRDQQYYATLHYAFVDFGSQKYDVGQQFKTISDITDQVNGEFKVIEKYGSFAVVVFTNTTERIAIGDKVQVDTDTK